MYGSFADLVKSQLQGGPITKSHDANHTLQCLKMHHQCICCSCMRGNHQPHHDQCQHDAANHHQCVSLALVLQS